MVRSLEWNCQRGRTFIGTPVLDNRSPGIAMRRPIWAAWGTQSHRDGDGVRVPLHSGALLQVESQHCTDPILEGKRFDLKFRCVKLHFPVVPY